MVRREQEQQSPIREQRTRQDVGFVVATGLKLFVCLAVAGLFLWSWLGA